MKCAVQNQKLQSLPAEEIDWEQMMEEAKAQSVELLLFQVISDIKDRLPEEIYNKMFTVARRRTASNMRVEFGQMELVGVLEQENYPYVILKGETAAANYPEPELRLLGDVDFLVPQEHTAAIAQKMQQLGYQHSWEPGDYHQVLEKPGACLEMHMEIAGIPTGKYREPVKSYMASIYEKSIRMDRGYGAFCAPAPEHQAMIFLLHMQHHVVEAGMGLRHIMDWACFVNRTASEDFWQARFLPLLKNIGLYHFAAIITKMASLYLGSLCPDWAFYADEHLCGQMMEDVLSGGNFGRKDQNRSRATNMMPDWEQTGEKPGKLRLLYRTLKQSVLKDHPELKEKPIGLFVRMTGKVGRYVVLYCRGKRQNLWKAASQADTRRSVYEQLRMFETEE